MAYKHNKKTLDIEGDAGLGWQWPSVRILCILLGIVAFGLYTSTLWSGYAMDDATVIYENSYVKKGIAAIPDLLTTPRLSGYLKLPADSYRPLSLIMFAVEYQLWGPNPAAGHFFSVLLFAGCVIVLFLFLHSLFEGKKVQVAFLAALLFAMHPIHTEVVANIKSRDELLAYFFGFLALLSFAAYAKSGRITGLVWGTVAYFLACLSKETVITFVAIIPLVFFFYINEDRRRSIYISVAATGAALLFLAIHRMVLTSHHVGMQGPDDFTTNALIGAPFLETRIPTAFFVLGKYLCLLFFPYPLLCNYSYSSIPFAGWGSLGALASVAVYCLLAGVGVWRLIRNRKDPWAFAILFYLITLSLFSNLFFLITSQMTERFLFFSSTGFCIAIALGYELLSRNFGVSLSMVFSNKATYALLLPVFILFAAMTEDRNKDWKDNYTLFSRDVEKSPDDCRLNYYKAISIPVDVNGDAASRNSAYNEKIGYLWRALAIYPDFAEAHTELGKIFEAFGVYDSALVHNMAVLRNNTDNSIATYHTAVEYYALKKYEDAIIWFKATIKLSPESVLANLNLAKCYADAHMPDSAVVYYQRTLLLDERQVLAQRGLAIAFLEQNKYDSAAAHMMKVIAQQPQSVDDINNLGAIYLYWGKYREAVAQFQHTLALNPGYVVAYGNMGNAYLQSGQYEAAIACFRTQLAVDSGSRGNIPNLVTAYEKAGKKDSAAMYRRMVK